MPTLVTYTTPYSETKTQLRLFACSTDIPRIKRVSDGKSDNCHLETQGGSDGKLYFSKFTESFQRVYVSIQGNIQKDSVQFNNHERGEVIARTLAKSPFHFQEYHSNNTIDGLRNYKSSTKKSAILVSNDVKSQLPLCVA